MLFHCYAMDAKKDGRLNVLHIVAGVWRTSGGLAEFILGLAQQQTRAGHQVTLAFLESAGDARMCRHPDVKGAEEVGVRVATFCPSWPHALYFSWGMLFKLGDLVEAADVVHVHSDWTFPVWWGCHEALARCKALVMSTHGCLEPERLKHSAIKKWAAGRLFDSRYLCRADRILATSEAEAQRIRAYLRGLSTCDGKINVVPVGVRTDSFASELGRAWLDGRWPGCIGKRIVLFLARLHPIKGADLLIKAWNLLGDIKVGWHLLIAGADEEGCEGELRHQVEAAGLADSLTFTGSLFGAERASALRNANLFVLPSRNENFGIAVAEALACGVPIITTKGAPWRELLGNENSSEVLKCESSKAGGTTTANDANRANENNFSTSELPHFRTSSGRCGWWVDVGVEPLANALREAMGLTDEERRAMGENGRRLVEAKYRWETVAAQMAEVYEKCVNAKMR